MVLRIGLLAAVQHPTQSTGIEDSALLRRTGLEAKGRCFGAMVGAVVALGAVVGCSESGSSGAEVEDADTSVTSIDELGTTRSIVLKQGGDATHGFWYSVSLDGFDADSSVVIACHDSVDSSFWTESLLVDESGHVVDETLCYSADGPDHWVTAGNVESNRVEWQVP